MPEVATKEKNLTVTDWNLTKLPPKGHKDVAEFAWELFEQAYEERERQGLPDRWKENDKLRRGDPSQDKLKNKRKKGFVPVNLYFANVERTVAHIAARDPVAEVIDMSGIAEEEETPADLLLTSKLRKWWKNTKQKQKLKTSCLRMESYGITVEHPYWNKTDKISNTAVLDCFSFFPAPGYYEDISIDCPYICNAYAEPIEGVEAMFKATGVEADDVYSILGEDREENRQMPEGSNSQAVQYSGDFKVVADHRGEGLGIRQNRALVVQVWVRDYTKETIETEKQIGVDEETGEPIIEKKSTEQYKYPGCIRVITITNRGKLLLADTANPNINKELPRPIAEKTYAWNHLPFYKANSYEDTVSIWGFSAAEQTEDLVNKISEIVSRMVAYVLRVMSPPLVVPQGIGLTRDMIQSKATKPNMVLMPNRIVPQGAIYHLQIPNLPADFFRVLELIINFFDRIYAIEDADRGTTPNRVVAASAIVALQERNAMLMQSKRESVEYLVEQRGEWAISFLQNFGIVEDSVDVKGEFKPFKGINYAGRKFQYTVESGSMMPRTSLMLQELAQKYYEMGVIDRQALLELTNFPRWKEIIERIGEGQLAQALQILVQAGLPEEDAIALQQVLMEKQGGPGNRPQKTVKKEKTQPGQPKAEQGQEV